MAQQRDQPERPEHGRQRKQQRDPRGDERPERDEQDHQREREREHARLAEILAVLGLDRLLPAGVAHLADEEAGVGGLGGLDRVEDRADLVGGLVLLACDVEADEHGVPVLRNRRRLDVTDDGHPRDAGGDVLDGRVEHRRAGPDRRLWTRTFSAAGCLNPASRMRSIRPDWPGPEVFVSMFFVPTMPPRPKATTTRKSQPKVAVFQWFALQRPIRAARLRCGLLGDISFPPVDLMSRTL